MRPGRCTPASSRELSWPPPRLGPTLAGDRPAGGPPGDGAEHGLRRQPSQVKPGRPALLPAGGSRRPHLGRNNAVAPTVTATRRRLRRLGPGPSTSARPPRGRHPSGPTPGSRRRGRNGYGTLPSRERRAHRRTELGLVPASLDERLWPGEPARRRALLCRRSPSPVARPRETGGAPAAAERRRRSGGISSTSSSSSTTASSSAGAAASPACRSHPRGPAGWLEYTDWSRYCRFYAPGSVEPCPRPSPGRTRMWAMGLLPHDGGGLDGKPNRSDRGSAWT